jgi:diguanylate cyclase (GGDEF)-like protein
VAPDTHVLVVDDDPVALAVLADILREEGFVVSVCRSPQEALNKVLTDRTIDVVTLDMIMPGIPGMEVLQQIRRQDDGTHRAPEVVIVSSIDEVQIAVQAIHEGAADYLVKPVNAHALKISIVRATERRLLLEENTRLKRDVALWAAGERLLETLEEAPLAERGVDALMRFTGADAGALLIGDRVPASRNLTETELAELRTSGAGYFGQSFDLLPPELFDQRLARFCGGMALGVGREHAALLFRSPGSGGIRRDFTPVEQQDAVFLSQHLASGFHNVQRFSHLQEEVLRDQLTGLANARGIQDSIRDFVERNATENTPFSVLFIDVDHFKTINDTYGHMVGSRVLVQIGNLLKRCVRDDDVVGRYGGDEFTVLLANTPKALALQVAERIRTRVAQQGFLGRERIDAEVTISAGVTGFPEDATDASDLIELADMAMYAGKRRSRNVVVAADYSMRPPVAEKTAPASEDPKPS